MDIQDPTTIGRYKVLHRLGAGAMGAVYLCQDPLLKRKVAVKIVLNKGADAEMMALRFQRESEISAQLNHPNIITVFDVGQDEIVGPFLTMEFIDGASLASRIEVSPPDARTAVNWLAQVGQALVASEKAFVVHRDIKPENILISKDDRVKLSDFGLARNEEGRLTSTGVLMGTPAYTAPELLAGSQACFLTDRWAFTVTAFQTVTGGHLPFKGTSISSLLHKIANEAPTLPEGMSAPLARVFHKALHREPSRRYDSVLAFMEALAQALGVPDALDRRGLTLEPQEPQTAQDGCETQAMPPPIATEKPEGRTPVPPEQRQSPTPPPGAPKLSGPPKDLLKGGADADPPPPNPITGAGRSSPNPHALGVGHTSPQYRSQDIPRPHAGPTSRPARTSASTTPATWLAGALLVLGAVYVFLFHPWKVRFESTPPGAEIFIDNERAGRTPDVRGVRFGNHLARIQLEGYEPESRTFSAQDDAVSVTLKPITCWANIITDPPGAEAFLGGRKIGTTPISGLLVPDRPQKLTLQRSGYKTWEGVLGPGKQPKGTIALEREP